MPTPKHSQEKIAYGKIIYRLGIYLRSYRWQRSEEHTSDPVTMQSRMPSSA